MTTQQLVSKYLQLRGELASAYAAEVWKACRLGHIEQVSRELATVEDALEATDINGELYGALVSGKLG